MDLLKRGTILCNRSGCNSKMDYNLGKCPQCGSKHCYIKLYWKGNHYKFRRDVSGQVLTVISAIRKLSGINEAIETDPSFNPRSWTDDALKERKFEYQWNLFMAEYDEAEAEDEKSPEYTRILRSYRRMYYAILEGYDVTLINLELLSKLKQLMAGKKPKTKANIINALIHFFNWLRRNGIIKTLPGFPEIDGKSMKPQRAIDSDSQLEALVRIPEPYRDVIEFGMELGLRPGETCALKVKDVDLSQGMILIERTWSGAKLRTTTKGGTQDWLPMSDVAEDIAKRHCQGKHPEAWLFVNPHTRGPFRRKRLGEIWNQYGGIPVKHYEACRHSFCTQIVESGASMNEAKLLMRHKDPRTTEKYFHGRAERLRHFVNKRRNQENVIPIKGTEKGPAFDDKK